MKTIRVTIDRMHYEGTWFNVMNTARRLARIIGRRVTVKVER